MSRGPGRAQRAVLADVEIYGWTIGAVIAREHGLSSDTVHRAIRSLIRLGKIESERWSQTGDAGVIVLVWLRDEDRPPVFESRGDAIYKDYANRLHIDAARGEAHTATRRQDTEQTALSHLMAAGVAAGSHDALVEVIGKAMRISLSFDLAVTSANVHAFMRRKDNTSGSPRPPSPAAKREPDIIFTTLFRALAVMDAEVAALAEIAYEADDRDLHDIGRRLGYFASDLAVRSDEMKADSGIDS